MKQRRQTREVRDYIQSVDRDAAWIIVAFIVCVVLARFLVDLLYDLP